MDHAPSFLLWTIGSCTRRFESLEPSCSDVERLSIAQLDRTNWTHEMNNKHPIKILDFFLLRVILFFRLKAIDFFLGLEGKPILKGKRISGNYIHKLLDFLWKCFLVIREQTRMVHVIHGYSTIYFVSSEVRRELNDTARPIPNHRKWSDFFSYPSTHVLGMGPFFL